MKYLVTIVTVPGGLVLSDSFETDHTLGTPADQLISQPTTKIGLSEQGQLAQVHSLLAKQVF
jgi:urease accessory protein UreH